MAQQNHQVLTFRVSTPSYDSVADGTRRLLPTPARVEDLARTSTSLQPAVIIPVSALLEGSDDDLDDEDELPTAAHIVAWTAGATSPTPGSSSTSSSASGTVSSSSSVPETPASRGRIFFTEEHNNPEALQLASRRLLHGQKTRPIFFKIWRTVGLVNIFMSNNKASSNFRNPLVIYFVYDFHESREAIIKFRVAKTLNFFRKFTGC
ncbi:hypothetical protein V1520DRAFT_347079 [Lipomyces starkeyi]|uniref:Uncharacterized protein n=1 Tax=Lipomyces starkeyi NRRL Y-11557 TaxID=675824 RepID=A0A1E3Q855_LIPST|nr:hypothetical protein LIPSTDRAFT_104930 [Lipomyces starkeyi NRRL Y-11557]